MRDVNHFEKNAVLAANKIDFADKVAVITGAGAGLGKYYAMELSKRGAKVVVNDFGCAIDGSGGGSIERANELVNSISSSGDRAVANYDSIATTRGGMNIVKTAIDSFGTIDILINNAGILRDKSFAKMTTDDWKSVLDVHLNGVYNVTSPAFKIMKSKGYGKIVMTTSAAGLYGNFGQTNYAAAKMALLGMMNSLKLEGRSYNVNVNTVAPISASRLTKDVIPANMLDRAKPDLVVPLVLYLCSDSCSDSGGLYNVGMGYVNRAAIFTGSWINMCKENVVCTPEEICEMWSSINVIKDGKEIDSLGAMFSDFLVVLGN